VGSECGGKDRRSGPSPSGIDINEYKTWGFLGIPYRKGSTPGLSIRARGMPIIGKFFLSLTTIHSSDSLLSILGEEVRELRGEGFFPTFSPLPPNGGLSSG